MSRSRVTIVDLARELGISKTTVSDALQGRGQVADATRERVRAAADRLGYVQNRAARNLRTSRLGAVGLHVPPVVREFSFYMEFAFGAVQGAAALDADLVLFARDPDHAAAGRPFGVDGAIVVDPLPDDPIVRRLKQQGVPVVTVGRCLGDDPPVVDATIEATHSARAREVLDDLWAAGRRRPAFLGSDALFFSSWAFDVRAAYLDWCADRGVQPRLDDVAVTAGPDEVRRTVEELVDAPGVDALVCAPQGFAGRARGILAATGRDVTAGFDLVSLVGDPATELGDPAITVVDPTPFAFGEQAAALLGEVLAGGTDGPVARFHEARIRRSDALAAALRGAD
jgi:DNA-binding LacI/PurR family transcriptional regulator